MPQQTILQDPAQGDPKAQEPKPDFPQPKISYPGSDFELNPKADHGEETYIGTGRLQDKIALVTGSDSGIGRAIAIAFAREGADLVLSYLPEEEKDAAETRRWVEGTGRRAVSVPGENRDENHCNRLVETAFQEFGKLDLLINNAGFQMTRPNIEDITTEEFDRTFKTNVYSMFWLCRAALPRMQEGGSIINTASIQSVDPSENLLAYAATKGAIANFTKGLAQSAMKRGVRVNAVAPGPVWTPLIPATMPEEKVKSFGKTTVFGRPAQPVEIAPVFVFLASGESRFVTGEIYGVTGGQTPL